MGRHGNRTQDLNEEVVIETTAPEKATHYYEWLRPRN